MRHVGERWAEVIQVQVGPELGPSLLAEVDPRGADAAAQRPKYHSPVHLRPARFENSFAGLTDRSIRRIHTSAPSVRADFPSSFFAPFAWPSPTMRQCFLTEGRPKTTYKSKYHHVLNKHSPIHLRALVIKHGQNISQLDTSSLKESFRRCGAASTT